MFSVRTVSHRLHGLTAPWGSGILSLLFPEKCLCCRTVYDRKAEDLPGLCPDCEKDLPWLEPPFCPRCRQPLPAGTDSHLCQACLQDKHAFDLARAAVLYRGGIAGAIQRFKYHGDITLASELGLFLNQVDLSELLFDTIIPVPLHPKRLRKRGFNQAVLLGKILSRKTGRPMPLKALRRIRNTVPQVELHHSERQKNVRGAFAVRDPAVIADRNVLLVDDVFTTGATVNECARVLKKSGAGAVYVLTLARVGVS
jgi:ComF family protein